MNQTTHLRQHSEEGKEDQMKGDPEEEFKSHSHTIGKLPYVLPPGLLK